MFTVVAFSLLFVSISLRITASRVTKVVVKIIKRKLSNSGLLRMYNQRVSKHIYNSIYSRFPVDTVEWENFFLTILGLF